MQNNVIIRMRGQWTKVQGKDVFLTSLLYAPPSSLPPVNLSLPPIIRDRAPYRDLGSEVRAVQVSVPGRKFSTEAKLMEPLFPPATTSACIFEIGVGNS